MKPFDWAQIVVTSYHITIRDLKSKSKTQDRNYDNRAVKRKRFPISNFKSKKKAVPDRTDNKSVHQDQLARCSVVRRFQLVWRLFYGVCIVSSYQLRPPSSLVA